MTDLHGRVALVTGGSRGIGAAISEDLAAAGAVVAIGYGSNKEKAEAYKAELNERFPDAQVTLHPGNIGVGDDCRRVIAEVLEQHGRLDILVNNAGITVDRVIAKMTDDDWNKVIAVNLSGAFYLSQAALAHMVERGSGRIINISSLIGEMGGLGQANYAASKSGLFALTKTMATEALFQLGRGGKLPQEDGPCITVNAVTPGYVGTEMVMTIPEKVMGRIVDGIPMKRLGHPHEIARVVRFLASDESGWITGQVWGVNGGQHM
jgi:acetoacetyl-CoA reductase/3-oxoacyl-[acyl-carrier protein] reductase